MAAYVARVRVTGQYSSDRQPKRLRKFLTFSSILSPQKQTTAPYKFWENIECRKVGSFNGLESEKNIKDEPRILITTV